MSFGGGGSGALPNHEHTNIALDGGPLDFVNTTIASLTANSMTYSDGAALQELTIGSDAQVLAVQGGTPAWITNTSNPLVKVSKTFADITALEMDIYTLPEDSAICNVWADITTAFDVSTAVEIGTGADNNGLQEAADFTAGTGLTDATRGTLITSFKNMLSTSGTTAIKAYGFATTGGGGSTFTQASTDSEEECDGGGGGRAQIGQRYEAGHVLIGEDVCKATFYIRSPSATSTGTVNCYVREGDGTLKATSSTSIDASTLTASFVAHEFEFTPAVTMAADDMIMVSFANGDIGSAVIKTATNAGNIANGEEWEEYNYVYQQKEIASLKQIITYDCVPVTGDTQGAVDFYLQVVN